MSQAAAALACLVLLVGCESATKNVEGFYDSKLSLDQPIDWWHQLQGGSIATLRPPPPGINDPYPTFANIPVKPTPMDPAARSSLLTRMAAERDRAQRQTVRDPIVFPNASALAAARAAATKTPLPAASPAPVLAPTMPVTAPATAASTAPAAASDDSSSLTFDAANAPGKPAASPAPVTPIDAHPPPAMIRPTQQVTSGPIPALPTTAPALPTLAGLPISVPVPVVLREKPAAVIGFAAGSAELPAGADASLRALAARAGGGPIAVHAGGDARSASPELQRAALPLALRRTGAITAALIGAGVPAASIRTEATAQGRDASARLVD